MKYFLLVLALVTQLAAAQVATPVSERDLDSLAFTRIPFPRGVWRDLEQCTRHLGVAVDTVLPPPQIILVPGDLLFVLEALEDTTNTIYHGPYLGYALRKTHAALIPIPETYNFDLLRHEGLHFWLWHGARRGGHPEPFYGRCAPLLHATPDTVRKQDRR